MIRIQSKRIFVCNKIKAPVDTIWAIITDTVFWPVWGPSITDVDCSERYIGKRSRGRVRTVFRFWLPFTITNYKPNQSWEWQVGSFRATGHTVVAAGPNACKLCFDMPVYCFFYIPVCWLALVRIKKLARAKK